MTQLERPEWDWGQEVKCAITMVIRHAFVTYCVKSLCLNFLKFTNFLYKLSCSVAEKHRSFLDDLIFKQVTR